MFDFALPEIQSPAVRCSVPCTNAQFRSMHWESFRDYLRIRAEEPSLEVHTGRDALVNSLILRF